jgi:hypothetical protein
VLQVLGWGGGEATLRDDLRATLSATYSHTSQGTEMIARLFDGIAALAWRFEWGMLVLRYTARDALLPDPARGAEQRSHTISLLPSIHLLSRLTVSAGGHVQWLNGAWGVLGSIRPAVRIIGGLEAGLEAAARSNDVDGMGYGALRAEVGYRFLSDSFLLAVGGTIIGYQQLDSTMLPGTGSVSRFYVRGEMAY